VAAFRRIVSLFRPPRTSNFIEGELQSPMEQAALAAPSWEAFARNVRYALRQLRRSPGFAATAVLALALGIGPNVAIFSIIWATFFAPLPYPHANRLVVVWRHYKGERIPTQGDEYAELAAQSKTFDSLSFQSWMPVHLTNADHSADQEAGLPTSPGLLTRTVQEPLAMGRDFLPNEGTPGNDHVVILTNWLWRHRYYADPNILSKSILIEDSPYTVIGVLKASPHEQGGGVEFAVPILLTPSTHSQFGILIGRLKPGVSLAQAQAELSVMDERYAQQHYGIHGASPFTLTVEQFRNDWLDVKTQRNLWLLLDAVGLVLMIACANIANLLLARGASRRQELAVRTALGASRAQIFVQLLTESLTLSLLGGLVGVGLGWALMKMAVAYLPNLALESTDTVVQMSMPVLGFALLIALFAGVVAGCAPSWRSARMNQGEALKQGSRAMGGGGRSPLQALLVVTEFALALTLLSGAGMALHSFWNLSHIDVGFMAEHVLTAELHPQKNRTDWTGNPTENLARQEALLEHLRQIPGVLDAALSTGVPMSGADTFPFTVVGQPFDPAHQPVADLEAVSPSFFSTFGVRLVWGRFLNDRDTPQSQPVVMVNETFVQRYLASEDPLNHRLEFPPPANVRDRTKPPAATQFQIVGVFHDVLNNQHLTGEVQPQMYICQWVAGRPFTISLRTVMSDPSSLSSALQQAVTAAEPGAAIDHVQTVEQMMEQERSSDRAEMILFGAFAAVALLLASVGIFGMMSFAVEQRTHEIGVRMALGARRSEVVRLVLSSGMRMATVGLCIGLAGALGLGRIMHSTLYGVKSVDALSLIAVAGLLMVLALVACWVPARRSAAVDPMRALRNE
jgi:putative ABC transport system permease protein